MSRLIVVGGSFAFGHEFYGPFDSPREALAYADYNFRPHTFTIVKLEEPDNYKGKPGPIVLLIGDGYNGHSIVGMFDTPESALEWEENHDADSEGYHVMWVEL